MRPTYVLGHSSGKWGLYDLPENIRRECGRASEEILHRLNEGPPFSNDPWLQMWVGASRALRNYWECSIDPYVAGLGRIKTSWEFSRKMQFSHSAAIQRIYQSKVEVIRLFKQINKKYYPTIFIPKNMNRGKLPF